MRSTRAGASRPGWCWPSSASSPSPVRRSVPRSPAPPPSTRASCRGGSRRDRAHRDRTDPRAGRRRGRRVHRRRPTAGGQPLALRPAHDPAVRPAVGPGRRPESGRRRDGDRAADGHADHPQDQGEPVSRPLRWCVLGVGVAGVGLVMVLAFLRMPAFGSSYHPYRDAPVPPAVAHGTANVVGSVTFDQRGIDTLGEEAIFFGSVLAVSVLLRPADDEEVRSEEGSLAPLQSTRLFGYLLLPLSLITGLDIVAHGHVTPGGGFQGGIMLATALHLVYVAGRYRSLEQLRPMPLFENGEAAGIAAFAALGFAGMAVAGPYLANFTPFGTFGQILSAGTVPLLNISVGLAVGSGGMVLLGKFFEQVFTVRREGAERS